jgi:hypothetical protein
MVGLYTDTVPAGCHCGKDSGTSTEKWVQHPISPHRIHVDEPVGKLKRIGGMPDPKNFVGEFVCFLSDGLTIIGRNGLGESS